MPRHSNSSWNPKSKVIQDTHSIHKDLSAGVKTPTDKLQPEGMKEGGSLFRYCNPDNPRHLASSVETLKTPNGFCRLGMCKRKTVFLRPNMSIAPRQIGERKSSKNMTQFRLVMGCEGHWEKKGTGHHAFTGVKTNYILKLKPKGQIKQKER